MLVRCSLLACHVFVVVVVVVVVVVAVISTNRAFPLGGGDSLSR